MTLIVDLCAYDPKYFDIKLLTYENMFTERLLENDAVRSLARRLTIDLSATAADSVYCNIKDLSSSLIFELPTINYARFNGLPYKYFYGLSYFKKPFSIVKLNVEDSSEYYEKKYEENGKNCLPNEPIFVENPNPQSEDDGVLLVMCLSDDKDFLSILDAKNLHEIARAELPDHAKLAFTFHGFFADSQNFEKLN